MHPSPVAVRSAARGAVGIAAVLLTATALVGCADAVDTEPVNAPVVSAVAERPAAPTDFAVTEEDGTLVARWSAPQGGSEGGEVLQYELFINSAPAITVDAAATTYQLPGVTADSGAYVQLRAVGEGGPGMTADATVERRWPEVAKTAAPAALPVQQPLPAPAPSPEIVTAPVPVPVAAAQTPVATQAPVAPPASAPVPAPAPAPAAPAPVAKPAPDNSITVEGTLRYSFVWPSPQEPFCDLVGVSLLARNGADEVEGVATVQEAEPVEVEQDEYTSSWRCEHKYSFTVSGDSPGYRIVAKDDSSDKVDPWERFYSTEQLTTEKITPYLSFCYGCSR